MGRNILSSSREVVDNLCQPLRSGVLYLFSTTVSSFSSDPPSLLALRVNINHQPHDFCNSSPANIHWFTYLHNYQCNIVRYTAFRLTYLPSSLNGGFKKAIPLVFSKLS
jgi:hypothetical protein